MRFGKHLAVAIALSLVGSAAHSDNSPEKAEPPAEAAESYSTERTTTDPRSPVERVEITVEEAVALALQYNLNVEVQRHAPLIAAEDVKIAWGSYDPTLSGRYVYTDIREPNTFGLTSADVNRTSNRSGNLGVDGLVPLLGATVSLDYEGTRTKTNSGVQSLSPEYESGLSISTAIPVLRGLVWNQAWTNVKVSGLQHDRARARFESVVMDTIDGAVSSYWNLVGNRERLRVAIKSLETSRALLDQTRTQYEVGVKSKVEVIQAEAGVAEREFNAINAEAVYRNTQDSLVDAIYGPRLTAISNIDLIPIDDPFDYQEYEVDPVTAVGLAMENRPEIEVVELDIENTETNLKFQKNQRLPQVDFLASYGTSGIEGKANPDFGFGPAEGTGGGYDETHDDWFDKRGGREYSLGAQLSIPLGNYAPRHRVTKARLELRRARMAMTQTTQGIVLEVRQGIRLLEAAREGLDAAERQRIAAEEQLRAERIRLEHGESTPFDVLEKESELVDAEVKKIAALQLYRTAASALDRAQGTILRTHNVVLSSVSELQGEVEPESFGIRDLLEPLSP